MLKFKSKSLVCPWAYAVILATCSIAVDPVIGQERVDREENSVPLVLQENESIAFSPDGKLLAVGGKGRVELHALLPNKSISESFDRLAYNEHFRALQHEGFASYVHFSPDGTSLAAIIGSPKSTAHSQYNGRVAVWDVASGERRFVLGERELQIWNISYSPRGDTLAIGASAVTLWSLKTGKLLSELEGASGPCGYLPDGTLICTAKDDRKILNAWSPQNGVAKRFAILDFPALTLVISPDGNFYATSEGIWELDSKKQVTAFSLPKPLPNRQPQRDEARLATIVFSRDSRWCAMKRNSILSPEIRVVGIGTRREIEFKPISPAVAGMAFSSDSRALVALVIVFAWEFPSSKKWLDLTAPEIFDLTKAEEK